MQMFGNELLNFNVA